MRRPRSMTLSTRQIQPRKRILPPRFVRTVTLRRIPIRDAQTPSTTIPVVVAPVFLVARPTLRLRVPAILLLLVLGIVRVGIGIVGRAIGVEGVGLGSGMLVDWAWAQDVWEFGGIRVPVLLGVVGVLIGSGLVIVKDAGSINGRVFRLSPWV